MRTTTAGAYTINPVSLDVSLSNMIVDNTTLNISLINMGKNAVTSVTLSWEDNGVTQTPINWTGNLADFMSDTILSIANLTSGLHNIKIWINNVNGQGNDNSQLNDTISQMFYICSGPLSGDYTVGTSSSDFESLETALWALNSCGVSGPIVLKLAAGTYAPISIRTTITGSSDINTITITSATGNANDVQFVANNGGAITLMNTNNWKFSSLSIDVSASISNSFGFYISGEKNTNIEIYNCNINIGINRDSLFGIYVDADSIENLKNQNRQNYFLRRIDLTSYRQIMKQRNLKIHRIHYQN